MPRYIDADYLNKLITQLIKEGRNITRNDYKMIDSILFEFPTADVVEKERYDRLLENSIIIAAALNKYQSADMVEVVRCKDCKQRDAKTGFCEGRGWLMQLVPDDGFCDKGKRREDG